MLPPLAPPLPLVLAVGPLAGGCDPRHHPRPRARGFNDVYIVYELMDTDLHGSVRSNQQLTEDHCQVRRQT